MPNLKELLPSDLPDLSEASPNTPIGQRDKLAFLNGQTHEVLGYVGQERDNMMGRRDLLRAIFQKNIDVQYNKRFTRYEVDEQGVKVHFSDGSTASGDILVGAGTFPLRTKSVSSIASLGMLLL